MSTITPTMTDRPQRTVIVGASVSGVRAARELRSKGYDGEIVVIGEESELPYDKTPLSKAFLAGERSVEQIRLIEADAAQALGIRVLLGAAATRLDVAERSVELASGDVVAYDACIIATGARARPSPWGGVDGVHVLRTLGDSVAIRADLTPGASVVVVGGGFIGSEVASTARGLGCKVTIVDPMAVPMGRVVGAELGELFSALHRRHGVSTRFGVGVESVDGGRGDLRVGLTDGTSLAADTVVVGIGAMPNVEWLQSSGLLLDDGVVCDEHCRTSAPDVYAIGDVARWFHPRHGHHVRVEHWTNANEMAACAAHNIAHPADLRGHAPIEYVWTDQYDWRAQLVGVRAETAESLLIGDPASQQFAALFGERHGTLTGALVVNWPRGLATCRRLLAGGSTPLTAAATLSALPVRR